ncbi:MAG TPA: carboxypeptidase regulatory-like domain-containing protein [Thermoanaerobaculia bacterium]
MWFLILAAALSAERTYVESWTWSAECPPQRAQSRDETPCADGLPVRVVAPPHARVLWGTEPMLRDLADAQLPSASTDEHGHATILAPKHETLFARVAGPKLASGWIEVRGARVELAASKAIEPVMQVRDADGDDAINARVELRTTDVAQPQGLVFRGAGDGVVKLPPIPAEHTLRTLAWSERGAPLAVGGLPSTITLPIGLTLRGRTLDVEGKPVAGAKIAAAFLVPRDRTRIRREATSDAGGAFVVRGLPSQQVQWFASREGSATLSESLHLDADTDLGTITLGAPRTIAVRVLGDGPIAGASVTTVSGEKATTDAEGRATIDVPHDGTTLTVAAKSFLSAEVSIDAETPAKLDVRLVRGASVRARIESGPGTIAMELDALRRIVDVGEDGLVLLDGLPAGKLTLEIRGAGAPLRLPERELAAGEQLDLGTIKLEPGLSIAGRVVDEAAAALAGAVVRVLRPHAGPALYAHVRGDWVAATSAADGTFTLRGLAPGVYTLWTETRGHAPLVRSGIELTDSQDLGDLTVPASRALAVRCVPVARCGSEASVTVAGAEWLTISAPLVNGTATIAPVPAGAALLRLANGHESIQERQVTVSRTQPVTTVELELSGVNVHGTVTRLGKPVSGGSVVLATSAAATSPVVMLSHSTLGHELIGTTPRRFAASVDASGRFTLEDIPPGDYHASWNDSPSQRVTIHAAKTFALRLDLAGGTIEGIVHGAKNEQVIVTAEANGRKSEVLTTAGEPFSVAGLDAGRVHVRARAAGLEPREAEAFVDVSDGRAATVELTLEPRKAKELTVILRSNAGIAANAFVFLRQQGALRSAISNSEGRATFRLENGPVEIGVYSAAHGWSFARVTGGAEAVLDLVESPAGMLITRADPSVPLELWSPHGFPIHHALAIIGTPMHRDLPLYLRGLPAGDYRVVVGGRQQMVAVTKGVLSLSF